MTKDLISRAAALVLVNLEMRKYGFGVPGGRCDQLVSVLSALPAVATTQTADPAVKADNCQTVWPDDICEIVEGFFEAVSDDDEWHMSDLHDHIRESLKVAAIETKPDPRDAVIARLVEALEAAEELYQAGLLGASPELIALRAAALAAAKGLKNE